MNALKDFHFFAHNGAEWVASTPERNLPALIKQMQKLGHHYHLFYVPLPYNAAYKIESYQPKVEGLVYLGYYTV